MNEFESTVEEAQYHISKCEEHRETFTPFEVMVLADEIDRLTEENKLLHQQNSNAFEQMRTRALIIIDQNKEILDLESKCDAMKELMEAER